MLNDRAILDAIDRGHITIDPFDPSRIQPASLDVRLAARFLDYRGRPTRLLDPRQDTSPDWHETTLTGAEDYFILHPGELVLAATLEEIALADHILARVEGKSSLGRLGVLVHATAGFIDPGWPKASITLELSNVLGRPIQLFAGMPIAQLAFERIDSVETGYHGKYVGQGAPAVSRYYQNWTGSRWA